MSTPAAQHDPTPHDQTQTAPGRPDVAPPPRGPSAPTILLGLVGLAVAVGVWLVAVARVSIDIVAAAPWVMLALGLALVAAGLLARRR